MKKLSKESYLYLLELIREKQIKSILSFCKGYGIDTNNYSSSVHYANNKLTIRYRTINHYFHL